MTQSLLPSLGHAGSGALGTVISTLLTYPLDLVNTRLKVQRQLRADGVLRDQDAYDDVLDAFVTIYRREGGVRAFFAGLETDLAKSAADSFLFFLFYTWFRNRRLVGRSGLPYLRVLEELAVGAAAGACAKAFTTPVSNVVTRRQTASLLKPDDVSVDEKKSTGHPTPLGRNSATEVDTTINQSEDLQRLQQANKTPPPNETFSQALSSIRHERGLLGLWAGYSASLVLTLNPSMTFFFQQLLKRLLLSRESWHDPGAAATFLLAAASKVAATSLTYPFQIAKARVQLLVSSSSSRPSSSSSSSSSSTGETKEKGVTRGGSRGNRASIFTTVARIARTEGVTALYDGIGGELVKGFFNHGITMLSKDMLHRLIVQLYFALMAALDGQRKLGPDGLTGRMREGMRQVWVRYLLVLSVLGARARRGLDRRVSTSSLGVKGVVAGLAGVGSS